MGLAANPLLRFGTDEQRTRFLAPVASGHALGCFALTEPQAGSDASNKATNGAGRLDDTSVMLLERTAG